MSDDIAFPLVSVVMSVYNGAQFLDCAMKSLLDQTYQNLEFVIIDDGSSDGSTEILRTYAASDRRIKLLAQNNSGLTRALIRGVRLSRGDFIARMDVDDYSRPDRISKQVELLRQLPNAVAVTCQLRYVRDDGTSILGRHVDPPAQLAWYLTFYNRIAGHGQVMFRRSAYTAVGGYDASYRFAQDHDLWVRMTAVGPFVGVQEPLYDYRLAHAESITQLNRNAQADYSFQVSQLAYKELTGFSLDREEAEAVRSFWSADPSGATLVCTETVDRILKTAFNAFADTSSRNPDDLRAISHAVGDRWREWAVYAPFSRPLDMWQYILRASAWQPTFAIVAAKQIAVRLARSAGKRFRSLSRLTRSG